MRRLTHEEFVQRVNAIQHGTVEIIDQYSAMTIAVTCRCRTCGRQWLALPSNLVQGKGCSVCGNKRQGKIKTKSASAFAEELADVLPDVQLLESYQGAHQKVRCRCKVCGNEWSATPHSLLRPAGCRVCGLRRTHEIQRKSHELFVTELKQANNEILVCGTYRGARQRLLVQCKRCSHTWEAIPIDLLYGRGCPICKSSKGERAIKAWLDAHKIEYTRQQTYDGLYGEGGRCLSYDFYLPKFNMLIEYQGEFHDHSASLQTDAAFARQQVHDISKKQYAIAHNIKLLEIWYYDYSNITTILSHELQNPVTSIV